MNVGGYGRYAHGGRDSARQWAIQGRLEKRKKNILKGDDATPA